MVDEVHIPIMMNSFSASEKYFGAHGIATITLGYSFIMITDLDNSNVNQKGEYFLIKALYVYFKLKYIRYASFV